MLIYSVLVNVNCALDCCDWKFIFQLGLPRSSIAAGSCGGLEVHSPLTRCITTRTAVGIITVIQNLCKSCYSHSEKSAKISL
jgi:hypothetical protein